jgi:hypothetical protein
MFFFSKFISISFVQDDNAKKPPGLAADRGELCLGLGGYYPLT